MRVRGFAQIAALTIASLVMVPAFAAVETLPAAAGPRTVVVLDPDDNDASVFWPGIGTVTELPLNYQLAEEVKDRLETGCRAEVVVTRDDSREVVPRDERKATAVAASPDLMVTLAFNGLVGVPWGDKDDGGPRAYARPADVSFAQGFLDQIEDYTKRPATLGVGTDPNYPWYPEYEDLGFPWAHVEALFLDHNFDWAWVGDPDGFEVVADAVMAGILDQMAAQGNPCAAYPGRPSAAMLQRLRNLGYQNYQRYGADPVSMSTGNFVTSEKPFVLPGVGSQEIDLTLNYNAQSGVDSQLGYGWSFEYGSYSQEFDDGSVAVALADGRTFLFQPDGKGGFTAPADAFASLRVSGANLVWRSTRGESAVFGVDDDTGRGHLASTADRQGNTITLAYSGMGTVFPKLATITDQVGQQVAVGTDSNGRITSFTRPGADTWTLGYSPAGDLVSQSTPTGRVLGYGYNDAHQLTSQVGADGVTFLRNIYDAKDRVVEQFNARGERRTMVFDDDAKTTTYTDTTGAVTVYFWDEAGRVTKVVDALSGETLTAYNGANQTAANTDAIGATTTTDYDPLGLVSQKVDPLGATQNNAYNSSGDLVETKDNMGPGDSQRVTGFTVNDQGRPVTTKNPDATTTSNTYNAYGDVTSSRNELGESSGIEYDGRGNTVKVTDPLGNETSHEYDLANRLVSTTDALGNTTSYTFDGEDNLLVTTYPNGSSEVTVYDINSQVVSVTDPLGGVTSYGYDAELNRTSMTLPNGGVMSYGFDAENRSTSVTDAAGGVTTFALDKLGRTTGATDPLGNTATTAYDAAGNVVAETDEAGNTTSFVRDKRGDVIKASTADGGVTVTTYDMAGRVTTVTDPRDAKTRYEYDWRGQELAVTDPLGHVARNVYDKAGRLIESIDAMGASTRHELDKAGQIVKTTNAEGGVTSIGYDAVGNQTSITDPLGNTATTAYDAMGWAISQTNALGKTARIEHDADGQPIKAIDPLGNETSTAYDAMGQVVSNTDALGRTVTYGWDLVGNNTTITSPDGTVTANAYDANANLLAVTANATVGAVGVDENVRTEYGYDVRGLMTTTTDANKAVTKYEHDAMGQVIKETNPIGKVTAYTYDKAGERATRVDAKGVTTVYSYSLRGELVKQAYSTGKNELFEYDSNGNQTKAMNTAATVITTYDKLGRPISVSDGAGKKMVSSYDRAGSRTSLTLPGGEKVTYGYDKANQNTSVGSPIGSVTVSFDAAGRPVNATRSNGAVTQTAYTPAGQIASLVTTKQGKTLSSFAYTYTDNGSVATQANQFGPKTTNATYTYDKLGRLTSSVGSALPSTYSYDAVGNRVGWEFHRVASEPRMIQANTYNSAGQLASTVLGPINVPVSYHLTQNNTWDANGNLILEDTRGQDASHTSTQGFAYDEENRLVAAGPANTTGQICGMPGSSTKGCPSSLNSTPTPGNSGDTPVKNTLTRTYDALGRVAVETNGKTVTAWTCDDVDPVYATAGSRKDAFIRDAYGDLIGERTSASGIGWYIQDALSSIYGVTVSSGAVLPDVTDYGDFGLQHKDTRFNFSYTGQRADMSNNGIVNYHARTYNPMTATWMQADQDRGTTTVPKTLHRYLFVAANPTTLLDALGYNWLGDAWHSVGSWADSNKYTLTAVALIAGVAGCVALAAVCAAMTAGAGGLVLAGLAGATMSWGMAADAGARDWELAAATVNGAVYGVLGGLYGGGSVRPTTPRPPGSKPYYNDSLPGGKGGKKAPPAVSGTGQRNKDAYGKTAPKSGSLELVGKGFSTSERNAAETLAARGHKVVLREADSGGPRMSDLLVDGIRYDVYTPKTGSVSAMVSAIARKGSQVRGGGVVVDLSQSPLTSAQVGDLLPRVQGVTAQISDIIVIGGK